MLVLVPRLIGGISPLAPARIQSTATVTASLVRSTVSHTTGKFYFEMTPLAAASISLVGTGVDNGNESLNASGGQSGGIIWVGNGNVNYNGVTGSSVIATFAVNDVLGVAVDLTNSLIWFRDNAGNWNNNGAANPATGTGGISISAITGGNVWALAQLAGLTDSISGNFAGPFVNAAPSGFSTW